MGGGKFRAFLCVSCVHNFGSKLCEYLMVVLSLCLWKYHRYNLLKIIDSVIAKVCFAHVITGWHSLDNVRSFQRTFGKLIFKGIRNSSIHKEMRMTNVYTRLLLESILFVLLLFVTYYGDQTIEAVCLTGISSPESCVGFLYFGWSNFWAEYSTVLLCCLSTSSWSLWERGRGGNFTTPPPVGFPLITQKR